MSDTSVNLIAWCHRLEDAEKICAKYTGAYIRTDPTTTIYYVCQNLPTPTRKSTR